MTKKEVIEKNIGMTFDFLRYLIDPPEMVDDIPCYPPDFLNLFFILCPLFSMADKSFFKKKSL